MRLSRLLPVALLILSACDDERTVITRTERLAAISLRDLPVMQRGGGVPVEIHGAPFNAISTEALTEALKAPPGRSQETRFRAVAPGQTHGTRMVLHFNPQGAPNAQKDCKRRERAITAPPRDRGFDVMLSFCRDGTVVAAGFLEAIDTEPGDMAAFTRAMQKLLAAIFAPGPDNDPELRG